MICAELKKKPGSAGIGWPARTQNNTQEIAGIPIDREACAFCFRSKYKAPHRIAVIPQIGSSDPLIRGSRPSGAKKSGTARSTLFERESFIA